MERLDSVETALSVQLSIGRLIDPSHFYFFNDLVPNSVQHFLNYRPAYHHAWQIFILGRDYFLSRARDSTTRFVRPSIGPSYFTIFMIVFHWPHCACPNGLVNSNMAPAHPHATSVAVYPALLLKGGGARREGREEVFKNLFCLRHKPYVPLILTGNDSFLTLPFLLPCLAHLPSVWAAAPKRPMTYAFTFAEISPPLL